MDAPWFPVYISRSSIIQDLSLKRNSLTTKNGIRSHFYSAISRPAAALICLMATGATPAAVSFNAIFLSSVNVRFPERSFCRSPMPSLSN